MFFGRNDISFASLAEVDDVLHRFAAKGVINAAAYTSVDQAESNHEQASFLNEVIPERLAIACEKMKIPLIHVSTDQVFDGAKHGMYNENDTPNPLNVYGMTKLRGEERVGKYAEESLIVRVSWIFGPSARNFIHLCLDAARRQADFSVVCDQIGKPTYGPRLAEELLRLMALMISGEKNSPRGILHVAGPNIMSRYEQAEKILDTAATFGFPKASCAAVTTAEFGAAARRPLNAVLDTTKAEGTFGISFRDFSVDLRHTIGQIAGLQAVRTEMK